MKAVILLIACLLLGLAHYYSAVKSGCFYAAMRRDKRNRLKKYIDNMHRVQVPFWYSLFGGLFFACMAILIKEESLKFQSFEEFIICLKKLLPFAFRSLIITMSTSSLYGVFYQGVINWGAGKSFIDPQEKRAFEIPLKNISIWVPKFWYGKNRIYISIFALILLIYAIFFW